MNVQSIAARQPLQCDALPQPNQGRSEQAAISTSAVGSVFTMLCRFWDPDDMVSRSPTLFALRNLSCIVELMVADSHKHFIFLHKGGLNAVVKCLLVNKDEPRRNSEGAKELQECEYQHRAGFSHFVCLRFH
jgi:hypothetical protein